jgi:tRNA 2-thiouridine synthesizing protein B
MATLHLIQSSIDSASFALNVTRYYSQGDRLLFLNDATYSLPELSKDHEFLDSNMMNDHLIALEEQVVARGLQPLIDSHMIELIDYAKFVKLTQNADKTISW